jgi:hypothetical protein
MLPIIGSLLKPIVKNVTDLIPDPNKRKEAKEQFEQSLLDAVMEAEKMQSKINLAEAKHKSIFVAGWRPFIGWTCGFALMWTYILQPISEWIIAVGGFDVMSLPALDMGTLMPLIIGMLGLAGTRTYEKMKGVARNQNG